MNKKEIKYLQFPLSMLPELVFNTQATITKIISYGIYRYSQNVLEKKEVDIEKALKQFLYYYYRKNDYLPEKLLQKMQTYISEESFNLDTDYNGFHNESFVPESDIDSLIAIIKIDSDFKSEILEFYWFYRASCFFKQEKKFTPKQILKIGSEVSSEIKPKEPIVSCKLDHLEDFYNNDKDEYEKIQLISFLAIKSILGAKKLWVKTNKIHIVCRMMGYSSLKELPKIYSENEYKLFNTYTHRYHIDKLIRTLELNWRIVVYSKNMKGMCIGLKDSISLENLIFEAEKNREKNRIINLKNLKRDAELKAKLKISNTFLTDNNSFF
jgi:hypothetical protein